MNKKKLKITHLFHSGFVVETETCYLVFDYYNYLESFNLPPQAILTQDDFTEGVPVYVFVSHGHRDHYDPNIFEWAMTNPSINYILSNDITINEPKPNFTFLSPYQEINLNNLTIKTFGSTDLGVSFLVDIDGLSIFHAGDLNWWHWKNDSLEEQKTEERLFKEEVHRLKNQKLDIAFIPVDPRLEEYYYLAGLYFAETIQPKLLIPMHFSDRFDITKSFKDKVSHLDVEVPIINHINQTISYFDC